MNQGKGLAGLMPCLIGIVMLVEIGVDGASAAEIQPEEGAWKYKANQCTNFSNASTWAQDCRILDGGTWTGNGTGSNPFRCIDKSHPRPWSSESLIEPLASARSGGTASLQGWLNENETVHCTGVFDTAGVSNTLGVESANVSLISINNSAGAWGAERFREIKCPVGSRTLVDRCEQRPVADPYRTFDVCPKNGTNPVNAFTGAKIHTETDFRGSGPNPLVLSRFYSTRTQWRHARWEESGFGIYWRHNYTRSVVHFENASFEAATVILANGNRYRFNPQTTGTEITWQATEPDITSTLAEITLGEESYWEFRTENGDRERYERSSGRLHHVQHGNGFLTSLFYDKDGKLREIQNGFGRSLKFTYLDNGVGAGLIESIALYVDDALVMDSVMRYEYQDTNPHGYSEMLSKVIFPDETPEDVLDNPSKVYLYNEPEHIYYDEEWIVDVTDGPSIRSQNHPTKLTGVIDENGHRVSTYKYQRVLFSGGVRYMLPVWGGHGSPDSQGRYANEYKVTSYHADSHRSDSRSHQGYASIKDALGTVRQFHFKNRSGVMRPTKIVGGKCEVCGSQAQQTNYDASGFVESEIDFGGNKTIYERNDIGLETCRIEGISVSDPTKNAPRKIVTHWQQQFRVVLEKTTYQAGPSADLQSCQVDTDDGWIIRHQETRTYEPDSRRLSSVAQRSFDANGSEDELPRVTTYSYYGENEQDGMPHQLKQIDGPRTDVNDTTTYRYAVGGSVEHNPGDLIAMQNGLGHTTLMQAHDAFGRPLRIVDPNGMVTELTYYARGWLKSRAVDGFVTRYEYDSVGQLKKLTLPDGSFITQDYDNAHRLTDIRDNLGNHIHYELDPMGNRISETINDELGVLRKSARQVINGLNQIEKQISVIDSTESIVTGYFFNPNGYLSKVIDPRDPAIGENDALPAEPQVYSEVIYDALNRSIANVDKLGGITWYAYDIFDRVKTVTEPSDGVSDTPQGLATQYTYNSFGELRTLQSPDSGVTKYRYDLAGNTIWLERPEDRENDTAIRYEYDGLNRLLLIDYENDELDVTYHYDEPGEQRNGIGRLTRIIDASGETSLFYDKRGNTSKVINTRESVNRTTEYGYDDAGRLLTTKTPGGITINYSYRHSEQDISSNWLEKVEVNKGGEVLLLAQSIIYLPFGPIHKWTFGNAIEVENRYDLSYRLKTLQHGAVVDRAYDVDVANNILEIGDNLAGGNVGEFQYDFLDRLTNATLGSDTYQYNYDALGNRTTTELNSLESAYNYEPNTHHLAAIAQANHASFSYDLNGNAIIGRGIQYDYGEDNRLKVVTDNTGSETQYLHNAYGQRTKKSGAHKTVFYYDLQGRLLEETDVFGNTAKTYVHMANQLLALIEEEIDPFADDDGDGMLNGFEQYYGLSLADSGDAELDADSDGYSNLTEHDQETDPTDSSSFPGAAAAGKVLQIPVMNRVFGLIAALIIMAVVLPHVHSASVVIALVLFVSWAVSESVYARVHFFHTDHLGTPIAMTDASQQITWRATYEPFGAARIDPTSTVEMNIRFPGQYYDGESGLYYNYFRDYDPGTGRYVQSDPIGLNGGINTYVYAVNNPLAFIDLYGLAYFAKRALSGLPWLGKLSNHPGGFGEQFNADISHEHLFFEDNAAPANLGLGPDGLFSEPPGGDYRILDGGYDDCVMRIAVDRTRVGDYCLIGIGGKKNNCQDWADRVRESYSAAISDSEVRKSCGLCDQ